MKLPQPELHTYFDEQLGERVFYACEPMAFDNGERALTDDEIAWLADDHFYADL